jgi:N-acetylglucosaminyldiphosphoundecaprenol N-acetyl-beta-D-mannosaminyltransferase
MRVKILGVGICKTNLTETLDFLNEYDYSKTGYICLPDMSVITDAQKDAGLLKILNQSLLTLPDGKPIEILLKLKGQKKISTVSGYWMIKSLLKADLSHFFYGASEVTCQKLKNNIVAEYPSAKILGFKSPPFVSVENIQGNKIILNDIKTINFLKPDIIWIGISSPKQDYLMYNFFNYLDHGIMIGVGGVFDYIAGTHKISPEWIKKIGLRWLFRLLQNPKRLWRKYYNTFIILTKLFLKKIFSFL